MRSVASFAASAALLATSRLTWAGVIAVVVFCVLVIDAQRRVRDVLHYMDGVNVKIDEQAVFIDELKAEVRGIVQRGGDDVADDT